MQPLIIRALGRFYLIRIPNWLHLWMTKRLSKQGDTIRIKLPLR